MSNSLPQEFSALEPFSGWALHSETERNRRRLASTQADIKLFVEAMLPAADAIVAYLDNPAKDTEAGQQQENLMCLLLSLAEVAPAIESYGQPAVVDGFESSRFVAVENFRLRPNL